MKDVAVIIPARNVAKTIVETLRSVIVQPRLAEIILVNDGSSDDTPARIAEIDDPRIKVIEGPCTGISGALNAGFAAATAPYVMRCDGDDLIPPDTCGWMADFLDQNPEFVALSGGFASLSPEGAHLSDIACHVEAFEATEGLRSGQTFTHFCAWMVRRPVLMEIGGARDFFELGEDVDLQFRLAHAGRVWHEPRVAYCYRLHAGSITHGEKHAKTAFFHNAAIRFSKQRSETGTDDLDEGRAPVYTARDATHVPNPLRQQMVNHLTSQAWRDFHAGARQSGRNRLLRAIRYDPLNAGTWKSFLSYLVKSLRRANG